MVYVPDGFAHGFQALADDTELFYQMSVPYEPASARGIRFDDPALAIPWPVADPLVSARDRALPALATLDLARTSPNRPMAALAGARAC